MNNFDLGKEITRGVESVGRAVQSIGSSIARGIDEVFNPGGAGGANRSHNEQSGTGSTDSAPISSVNGLAPRAESLRAQGNEALKTGHLAQALNLYTQAINVQQRVDHRMKGQSRFCALFSNRSAVFMQLRQYENALEDACRCLELNSTWPKVSACRGRALTRWPRCFVERRCLNWFEWKLWCVCAMLAKFLLNLCVRGTVARVQLLLRWGSIRTQFVSLNEAFSWTLIMPP